MLNPGYYALRWNRSGEAAGDISIRSESDSVRLIYSYREYGGEWKQMDYAARLTYTACHYGGVRAWFRCPSCSRRCAVIYGPGDIFACRTGYRVAYNSQSEDFFGRMTRKAQNIQKWLGGKAGSAYAFPPKPKAP